MVEPLQGIEFYSFTTLKLKVEMDLLIKNYFN